MPELIDKAKVLKYLTPRIQTKTPYGEGYNRALEDAAELVTLMPTIEPEVRHGRWKEGTSRGSYSIYCSYCGAHKETICPSNYCPNCGARMDGGADNDSE